MYKNQLQELAQRSCFNLPSYTCIREGPDHAPRFKAIVNFNGETFDTPHFCSNLRQAEHAAAEAALISLSSRAPSHSLAARILDETGVYKNLLQEIAQRVGSPLPRYTTYRHGLGHLPVFTGIVELAGITFKGEPAKNKKQAEKNAAQAAWLSLKQLAQQDASSSSEHENTEEQEQIRIARALQNYHIKEKFKMANSNSISLPFQRNFSVPTPRSSSPQHPTISTSKILPLFCQKNASQNKPSSMISDTHSTLSQPRPSSRPPSPEIRTMSTLSQPRPSSRPPSPEIRTMSTLSQPRPSSRPPSPEIRTMQSPRFPVIGAAPYTPINLCRTPYQEIAPPISIRTSVPVFSAPPLPPPIAPSARVMQPRANQIAPPVRIRQTIPVFSASHGPKANPLSTSANSEPSKKLLAEADKESAINSTCDVDETTAIKCLEQLEI